MENKWGFVSFVEYRNKYFTLGILVGTYIYRGLKSQENIS